ncbi:MAG TPA: ribosome maturation factor RimM [Myxococcales bacterium]|nr:ribosome maturation factor RimM [Myxococcales bacterium]
MAVGPAELLAVGRVARAHGVRGRVLIAPYNPQSAGLERASALWLARQGGTPRRIEVDRAERAHLGYLVALRGVDDRNAADALRGEEVLVPRAELPALDEGELYAVDLVGMAVVDAAGTLRGRVTALETAGRQELLTVRTEAGTEALVPLGLLREVREEARELVIDVPDGLFEVQEKQQEKGPG